MDRWVPSGAELLGLGELRRQPYVSSGLVFAGQPLGERVLGLMDGFDRCPGRATGHVYVFYFVQLRIA